MSEIVYLRKKAVHIDRIVYDDKTKAYLNKRVTKIKGFDHILGTWSIIDTKTELLDVKSYPTNPEKVKTLFVVLKRSALDPNTLKQLTKFFKQALKVTCTSKNVYLVLVTGKLFQTCVATNTTSPIGINLLMNPAYLREYPYLTVEISEPEPITNAERETLLKQGFPLYEEQVLNDIESEFRTMV